MENVSVLGEDVRSRHCSIHVVVVVVVFVVVVVVVVVV